MAPSADRVLQLAHHGCLMTLHCFHWPTALFLAHLRPFVTEHGVSSIGQRVAVHLDALILLILQLLHQLVVEGLAVEGLEVSLKLNLVTIECCHLLLLF